MAVGGMAGRKSLHIPFKETPLDDEKVARDMRTIEEWAALQDFGGGDGFMSFPMPGYLSTTYPSIPQYVRTPSRIAFWRVSLKTAGSTDTVVGLYVNDISQTTLTLTSSDNTKTESLGIAVDAEDEITVQVTTAGTGAADLGCQVYT